MSQSTII